MLQEFVAPYGATMSSSLRQPTFFTHSASAVGHGVEASSPSLIKCEDKGKIGTLSGAGMRGAGGRSVNKCGVGLSRFWVACVASVSGGTGDKYERVHLLAQNPLCIQFA